MGNKSKNQNVRVVQDEKMDRQLKVTTIESLREYADKGAIVRLPDFAENVPFVARLKRPSLTGLIAQDVIPNQLQVTAIEMFDGKINDNGKRDMKAMDEIFTIFAKECLVEPTYEELEEIGLELTDEQKITIFNYSQMGVKALNSFRKEQTFSEIVSSLQKLQEKPIANDGNK